jgi:putative transposase
MANLDAAFTSFFRKQAQYPKFKSRKDHKSYSTDVNITVEASAVRLPKLHRIRAVITRPITGRVQSATVTQTATGKYFVSIATTDDQPDPLKVQPTLETTVGIDLGLTHFATLSTGEKVANPRHLKKSLKRLRRAQRIQSRRAKGGKNRNKARLKVARIHEQVANCRQDFRHKLSTRLIRENQAVAIETLNVSGMQKNSKLARSIADAGWTQFVSMLEYKAGRAGKHVLRIGRFEPSSKLCSCGVINRSLTLKDRRWTCPACGVSHDRDVLAANNIKKMALNPKNFIGRDAPEFTPGEIVV